MNAPTEPQAEEDVKALLIAENKVRFYAFYLFLPGQGHCCSSPPALLSLSHFSLFQLALSLFSSSQHWETEWLGDISDLCHPLNCERSVGCTCDPVSTLNFSVDLDFIQNCQ